MGILTNILAWAQRGQVGNPLMNRAGGTSDAGETVTDNSSLALSAVWACVNLLSGTISSLPLMVYRIDAKGQRTLARDHWAYRLLHDSPNAEQTALDFWDGGAASIELKGNMLADKLLGSRGQVVGLQPIPWDAVSLRRDADGALIYRWGSESRTSDGVLHIRGFGGAAEGGLSTLAYARQAFGLALAANRAAGGMFANGMRPSGVLSTKDWMKADQRAEYRALLEENFAGAMNAGRPLVLEGGTTWAQLSITPEDAQMLQQRGFSVEEICRFFGVPPFMVGHTEKTTSWGTGLEQQVLGFQKFTLRRRLERIEQALMKQLLTPADRAGGIIIEFNVEGLLRGDSTARSNFYGRHCATAG